MNKAVMELVVGITFVLGVALVATYTIVLSGFTLGTTKKYVVDFKQVYGLKQGDAVRVEGFEKGEVLSLRLLPGGKIRAVMVVSDDVEIYKDGGEVRVTPFSPLGGRVVEIKRGVDGPRGKHVFFDHADGVTVDQAADQAIQGEAEGELLQTLNALVEENRKSVKQIVDNLTHVSKQLTKTDNALGYLLNSEEGGQNLATVGQKLSSSAQRVDRILSRVESGEGVIGGLLKNESKLHKNVDGAVEAGKDSLQSLSRILKDAEDGESALGVLVSDNDPRITQATRGIVSDVKTITGRISEGQGTLGKLSKDDRLYEGFAGTGENLKSITKKIDSGKGLLAVLLEKESGDNARKTLKNLASITDAVNDPEAGAIGLLINDRKLRRRIARITEEVEGLITEFRDSLEDVREQAPVNAFIGAVFSAF